MKGACDAHFHVFGPPDRYPARDPKIRYKPPYAPLEDYLAHARAMGFERFVFVQPSAYLRDNTCMLDAMREMPGCRGIVDVDENAPDAELEAMHKLGVRGVRITSRPSIRQSRGSRRSSCRASSAWRRAAPSSAGTSTSCCQAG